MLAAQFSGVRLCVALLPTDHPPLANHKSRTARPASCRSERTSWRHSVCGGGFFCDCLVIPAMQAVDVIALQRAFSGPRLFA